MTGYQETLTDPSYRGQIVVMTAPHIGNTGVNDEDFESRQVWVEGYVVRDPARRAPATGAPTARSTTCSTDQGVVGISGIDTRALTRHLRERGAMRAARQLGGPTDVDDLARRGQRGAGDGGLQLPRRRHDRPRRTSSRRSARSGSPWRRSTSASRA